VTVPPVSALELEFSLVVSTIGRPALLRRLVRSIEVEAIGCRLELIVVDQSDAQSAAGVLQAEDLSYPWRVDTSPRGVSRGRNHGLSMASGRYVSFTDDDCWFPGTTLRAVADALDADSSLVGVTTPLWNREGEPHLLRWAGHACGVSAANYYRTSIGPTMFFRLADARRVGGFDPNIGPGAGTPYGSCEDADFLLRALALGTMQYLPSIGVHHDPLGDTDESTLVDKMGAYGAGQGWFWRTHRYPRWHVAYLLGRKLVKTATLAARGRADEGRADLAFVRGAVRGLRASGP